MEIKITLGGEEIVTSPREFLASCAHNHIKVKTDTWGRVVLYGQNVTQARALLCASRELEAAVLLELAKDDRDLTVLLEERAGILADSCLPDDPFSAALATVGPGWPDDNKTSVSSSG